MLRRDDYYWWVLPPIPSHFFASMLQSVILARYPLYNAPIPIETAMVSMFWAARPASRGQSEVMYSTTGAFLNR